MHIKKGTTRLVIIFECLGIAIKLPRIYFTFAKNVLRRYKEEDGSYRRGLWLEFVHYSADTLCTIKYWLFKGVVENWREFVFYQKNRSKIFAPTCFSLFGLINFQKAGKALTDSEEIKLCERLDQLANAGRARDPHTFINPKNYCFFGQKLKAVDYGNPDIQKALVGCEREIMSVFDNTD